MNFIMIIKARGYMTDKEQLKTGMGSFITVDAEREFQKRWGKGQTRKKLKTKDNKPDKKILRKFKKQMD